MQARPMNSRAYLDQVLFRNFKDLLVLLRLLRDLRQVCLIALPGCRQSPAIFKSLHSERSNPAHIHPPVERYVYLQTGCRGWLLEYREARDAVVACVDATERVSAWTSSSLTTLRESSCSASAGSVTDRTLMTDQHLAPACLLISSDTGRPCFKTCSRGKSQRYLQTLSDLQQGAMHSLSRLLADRLCLRLTRGREPGTAPCKSAQCSPITI